ncbi:MAG: hypothetical protein JXR90_11605 [Spirochaetes bacterium]|nr:hypothetical protein [Spirochaetota bacterium]
MEGIVLFVDDQIFDPKSNEYKLFFKLKEFNEFDIPIIPINNLYDFEKSLKSMSIYNAILLDWEFKVNIDGAIKKDTPYDILIENNIFSIIYVYSQFSIGETEKSELKQKYGDKIEFLDKINDPNDIDNEIRKIVKAISNFKNENSHLYIPFIWGNSINQSTQTIFSELEHADPNWLKEIYNNAKADGADPNSEILSIFQNLLNESVYQNVNLINSFDKIKDAKEIVVENKEEATAKLFNRLYYTKLNDEAPISTGDIFKFTDDEYAILISPECDLSEKGKDSLPFEFIKFSKTESERYKKKKKGKTEIFNNGTQSKHILPSFPFEVDCYNLFACINFKSCMTTKTLDEFKDKRTEYKMNSPFIFQLRQRYFSSVGRIGVPAIPESLRTYNFK